MSGKELLHRSWEEANSLVREVEDRLAAAWAAFAAAAAGPPGADLLAEIAKRRRECDERLAAILQNFSDGRIRGPLAGERAAEPNIQAEGRSLKSRGRRPSMP